MPRALLIFRWKVYWGQIRTGRVAMAYFMQLLTCLLTAVDAFAMPRHVHIDVMRSVRDCWTVVDCRFARVESPCSIPRLGLGQTFSFVKLSLLGYIPADDYGRR
ncbi:hypothetical protein BDV09DRAFT_181336 [Aspergillus tetrazonus]